MFCRAALVLLLLTANSVALADGNKLERTGEFADPAASESVKKALEPIGYRVTLSDGTHLCDIWLRVGLPASGGAGGYGVYYTQLPESVLVGVMSFPNPTPDFRGQGIKPGSYTLRYSLHPPDGNHMGISAYRDFLLLVPVSLDQDVAAVYKFEDLTKMSAKTNGSNHPSPISLTVPDGSTAAPGLVEADHDHLVFVANIKTAGGGEIAVSFVVKGVAEQ